MHATCHLANNVVGASINDFRGFDGQKKARFVTLPFVVSAVCIAQN